jgi:hypothetical protein
VRVALGEAQDGLRIEPRVHASYDRDLRSGRHLHVRLVERLRVFLRVLEEFVGFGHH